MLVPTLAEARYLILDDGDLPSALSVALASERSLISGARADSNMPVVVPAWWRSEPDQTMPLVHKAVQRHASLYGVRAIQTELVVDASPESGGLASISRLLLAATELAASEGCDAVLFPVRGGDWSDDSEPDLESIAREVDRAALVSRLAAIDADPCAVATPLVDLDDVQTIDLARDLSVPTECCWWSLAPGDPLAEGYAARWRSIRGLTASVGAGASARTA